MLKKIVLTAAAGILLIPGIFALSEPYVTVSPKNISLTATASPTGSASMSPTSSPTMMPSPSPMISPNETPVPPGDPSDRTPMPMPSPTA